MRDTNRSHFSTILILGLMTALSPFSIDMYLPAFAKIAQGLGSSVAQVAMSLTSYFVGLASGQLIYGPLMDRYGRKRPLLIGLVIYIAASVACGLAESLDALVAMRFVQALGGCGAGVAAFAMVRDLFSPRESAKVLSTLVLILGASPLLAPTIGSKLAVAVGWPWLFHALGFMGAALFVTVAFGLPESRGGDPGQTLHPVAILKRYASIVRHPAFYVYALAGAIGFSGLFVYLAASPAIFMQFYGVGEETYGLIFAGIAAGFVLTSQMNVVLLKKFSNETILRMAFAVMVLICVSLTFFAWSGRLNVAFAIVHFFGILATVGLANPNATALAMAPFGHSAGSAAALVGFAQMTIGALASFLVSLLPDQALTPVALIFLGSSTFALILLLAGQRIWGRALKAEALPDV